jgi:hypothetical protein
MFKKLIIVTVSVTYCLMSDWNSCFVWLIKGSAGFRPSIHTSYLMVHVICRGWMRCESKCSIWSQVFGHLLENVIRLSLWHTSQSLTDLALWQAALSCWYRQSSSLNWSSSVDSTQRVRMSLYLSAFRFPCSITRGPSPFHENTPTF